MARPTRIIIDKSALLHNVQRVKWYAPHQRITAMVKANAYGCGLDVVAPALQAHVDAFGVACIEEAEALRALGIERDCVLFQGVFSADEWPRVAALRLQSVIHEPAQLQGLLAQPLFPKITVWVKVDTGMHRLGFHPTEIPAVLDALKTCPWVQDDVGLMTHLACADEPTHPSNVEQLNAFYDLANHYPNRPRSMANSAALMALPAARGDWVRPGIMLYGASPFANKNAQALGLLPVMRFESAVSAIHHYEAGARIGYGGSWHRSTPAVIAVVAAGYGDGYPRHLMEQPSVFVNGELAPVVGRVSMDVLTMDVTDCKHPVRLGDRVELWGPHIPVEAVASAAGTIAYELLCRVRKRG